MRSFVRTTSSRRVALSVAAIALSASSHAFAQMSDAESAARRSLIDQATAARTANNPRQALDLAQRAGRIQMTPSLRMFIAETHASMGNHADAMGAADRCVQEADRDTAASNRTLILSRCRAISEAARARVGYVTVTVNGANNASVRVNDTTLSDALMGVPFVVNAGAVRITATAAGFSDYTRELNVNAGSTVVVDIALQRATSSAGSTASGAGSSAGSSAGASGAASGGASVANNAGRGSVPGPSDGAPARVAVGSLVLMGVGGASLAASLGFYLARNASLAGCNVTTTYVECVTDEQARAAASANTHAIASAVALGVGAAAVVGGAIWLGVGLATGSRRRAAVAPTALVVGSNNAVLGVVGSF
ncbi:MAG: hypothetical protein JNK05_36865 [Myxococcales bacterium]|nr:hypothetical protein [Myxococcales bacterium]